MIRSLLKRLLPDHRLPAYNEQPPVKPILHGVVAHKMPENTAVSDTTATQSSPLFMTREEVSSSLISNKNILIVDVRSPQEWLVGRVPESILIPHVCAKGNIKLVGSNAEIEGIVVVDAIGDTGGPAEQFAEHLRDQGWPTTYTLQGGYAEWIQEGELVKQSAHTSGKAPNVGDNWQSPDGRTGTVWWVQPVSERVVLLRLLDQETTTGCFEMEFSW